ncbi:helix-turn-helix domain-containing protein [Streptomyces lonarensis]|uniref:Helix-turn-helix domain-containing protein n=1 Tax=Streptomyces lonarensis TaxID=700599 RepID=A0A7X6HYB4_9ACTN|nr:helix-turn-helix domain-containing protein [Streptomyces lonarensis]NJQ05235.1 helix-turn-helix domain-containing protein [Streptomyces lonarensis]
MADRRSKLARQRKSRGFTQESFAHALGVDRTTVQRWERGEAEPHPTQRPRMASLLGLAPDELCALLISAETFPADAGHWLGSPCSDADDELQALELARRVQASDVGAETLHRLELAFEELAKAYPVTPPLELLDRVRKHISYVGQLLEARKTLAEHQRLLTLGGWLSLLGATLHIDVNQPGPATARLNTAVALAKQAGEAEIESWCYETEAWRVLTDGDYKRALDLSLLARHTAPAGSSVAVQAAAQEGRVRARLGHARETYLAVDRVQNQAATLSMIRAPDHHYQYDPGKSVAYTATTLAWIGDPTAEGYAREVIAQLAPRDGAARMPRRAASAYIDLALTLLATDRLDEASAAAQRGILSGRIVPSNHWRALEIVTAVERRRLPEAADLRDAYEEMRSPPHASRARRPSAPARADTTCPP